MTVWPQHLVSGQFSSQQCECSHERGWRAFDACLILSIFTLSWQGRAVEMYLGGRPSNFCGDVVGFCNWDSALVGYNTGKAKLFHILEESFPVIFRGLHPRRSLRLELAYSSFPFHLCRFSMAICQSYNFIRMSWFVTFI